MSHKCFQYTKKLRHNVVYLFSIFYDDVITPNLGNYRMDIMISSHRSQPIKTFEILTTINEYGFVCLYCVSTKTALIQSSKA